MIPYLTKKQKNRKSSLIANKFFDSRSIFHLVVVQIESSLTILTEIKP